MLCIPFHADLYISHLRFQASAWWTHLIKLVPFNLEKKISFLIYLVVSRVFVSSISLVITGYHVTGNRSNISTFFRSLSLDCLCKIKSNNGWKKNCCNWRS